MKSVAISALSLAAVVSNANAAFSFADFTDPTGLTVNGYTSISGGVAYLSDGTESGAGSMFHVEAQTLSGPWSTSFTYSLTDGTPPDDFTIGADGFAFVITGNGPTSLGGGGGNLGLNGGFGGAAVMFRSWDNSSFDIRASATNIDPFGDTLIAQQQVPLEDEDTVIRGRHTVVITYTPGILSLFMDGSATPTLTADLDLTSFNGASLLDGDGKAWIGFTAGTGLGIDVQQISEWSFVPAPGSAGLLAFAGIAAVRRRRAA